MQNITEASNKSKKFEIFQILDYVFLLIQFATFHLCVVFMQTMQCGAHAYSRAVLISETAIDHFSQSCKKMAESSGGGNANSVRVGHYSIEKTIGKGNFAVVKLAKNVHTNSEVT